MRIATLVCTIIVVATLTSVAQAATGTPEHPAKQTWQQARHNVGGYACVTSKVLAAKRVTWKSGAGFMTFIDFGFTYPSRNGLTVVVWKLNAERLRGRTVTACGPVTLYKGTVELSTDRMPR